MVPCYNEGDKELRKTLDSVMDTSYPDDNKVLLVVADGTITGKGEKKSTPETLAQLLGYKMSANDRSYKCKSIGELQDNRAKLYYGTYKDCGKELKVSLGFVFRAPIKIIDNQITHKFLTEHPAHTVPKIEVHCDCKNRSPKWKRIASCR